MKTGARSPLRIVGLITGIAIIVIAIVSLGGRASSSRADTATDAAADTARTLTVETATAERMVFERVLVVQGNIQAKNLAVISPRVEGVIDTFFVDEGDVVQAGITRLFQTDPVKLTKTVEMREHEVDVAECSLQEKKASLEKAQADYDKADYDWKRYNGLYEKGASSDDEMEDSKTEYRRCAAMLKYSQALVDLSEAQLSQSKSLLAIAMKDLDDSLGVAPISGRVAIRYQEPGEMGRLGTPVLRIEDPSLLEVSVFLPSAAYDAVVGDKTMMNVVVNGTDLGEHAVYYKSPTISNDLRTFEARCLLHDPPADVVPGAMAQVRVILESHEGLGVPRDAVQRRVEGNVIFVADGGKARRVAAKVGLETNGRVELTSDSLREGAEVVVVGGYFLNDGAPIKVQKESR